MANSKPTFFQRMNKFFGTDTAISADYTRRNVNTYKIDNPNVIFATKDKTEYDMKSLELRQNKLLNWKWRKANIQISNEQYMNIADVKMMFRDADLMDGFPEFGAAADILAEEACAMPSGNKLRMVNVFSRSERIKAILEDLLYNRLQINMTLPMIARAGVKYGNCYMLHDIDLNNGVRGWRQLPVYEVERYENMTSDNPYYTYFQNPNNIDLDKEGATRFVWVGQNEFTPYWNWQISHFRLLYDSQCLPYGCSFFNKARRHFRMLSMMEDAMLMYRLERAVERRVFKVNVASIDEDDVQAYVEDVANEFKRTPIIDPLTGQLDLRKNLMPVWKGTPIPLLDGRIITIEDLAKEYENGKTNYVYSIQDRTQQVVPGKVVWCGKNYTAKQMVKVTLDDGGYILLAPEHEFVMRDGSKKRADQVSVGESVMPFYTEFKSLYKDRKYETVFNPNTGKFDWTHRLIADENPKPISDKTINTVHHKNFNKMDNTPDNLLWCNFHEHHKMHGEMARNMWEDEKKRQGIIKKISDGRRKYYAEHGFPQEIKDKISRSLKETFKDPKYHEFFKERGEALKEYTHSPEFSAFMSKKNKENGTYEKYLKPYNESELHKEHDAIRSAGMKRFWQEGDIETAKRRMTVMFDDYVWAEIENGIYNGVIYNRNTMLEFINNSLIEHLLNINSNKRLHNLKKISRMVLQERIHSIGFDTITDYINDVHARIGGSDPNSIISAKKSENMRKFNAASRRVYVSFDDNVYTAMRTQVERHNVNSVSEMTKYLNDSMIEYIRTINNLDETYNIDVDTVTRRIVSLGFKNTSEYFTAMQKNHKIVKIELVEGDDVYCMTVVGLNGEEDRHNFALLGLGIEQNKNNRMSGCFVSNCNTEDFFIPVRDPNEPNPIETLQAAQNLTALDDIKYVLNKILIALRIPKAFLNFEETAGDGKNLSLMDVRFMRTVNRVQQMLLLELNKVCIIHLAILGFTDDLTNFTLTMNNPSSQAEMLEIENLAKKITTAKDAITDGGNGIPLYSCIRAWKEILGWSEKEISDNLEELRLETALAAELQKTAQIIKRTGLFDNVDNVYGEPGADYSDQGTGDGENDEMAGGMGGGGGAAAFGGDMDMGAAPEGEDVEGSEGDMGLDQAADEAAGGEAPDNGGEGGDMQVLAEAVMNRKLKRLNQRKRVIQEDILAKSKKYSNMLLDKLNEKKKQEEEMIENIPLFNKSFFVNEELDGMSKHLDAYMEERRSLK